jgi:glycosyltransferase involved in cell wall biosynthesis
MRSKDASIPESKQRILFIDQYAFMGGGQRVLLQLIETSMQNGLDVTILAPAHGELEASVRDRFGTEVRFSALKETRFTSGRKGIGDLFRLIASLFRMVKHLPQFAWADIVYINGPRVFFAAFVLSLFLRRNYFYHIHLNHSGLEKFLIYLIVLNPRTQKVILSSHFVYEELLRTYPSAGRTNKVVVLQNSLSSDFSHLPFVDRWQGKPLSSLACIGRITPDKGQSLFIELAKYFPRLRFILIGSSDFTSFYYEEELRREAPSNVTFYGNAIDVISAVNDLNIQVSIVPSLREEAFGLVAIESMACSLFTITSGRGELKSISSKTGAWVAQDMGELKTLLTRVANMDPQERSSVTRDMYERTLKTYPCSIYQNQWFDLISRYTL